MIAIWDSGQKAVSVNIIAERFYYVGCMLRTSGATACILQVHNCAATGDATADNMVAEISVPAVANTSIVDNPKGAIECPLGITAILTGGTGLYHVRGSALPF